jgi:glycosyltransferase involved in cell wall biosynthesis
VRILIASDVARLKEAGTAGVVLNHASELRKRGHDVDCVFLDDLLDERERKGRFAALRFSSRIARRIQRDAGKYDVVNLHGPSGCVYGLRRKLGSSAKNPPFVFTIQGIVERYAHVMRREQRKGRAWHFGLKNRLWHRFYHQTMFSIAIRTADYGIASNREAWTYPELIHDVDPGRIHYVPNGVEEAFFVPRSYEDRNPARLLFVGTWLDRKGVYYLVDALQALVQKGTAVQLTIAGSLASEEEVMTFFPPEARNHVRVLPFATRQEMPALYAEHDIFVFPSLMEGMPLSLLEAMAMGMPVVSTYNSGMADVIEDRLNGLAIPDADAPALAQSVEELCGSLVLRKQLGEQAARTMRRYTWECVTRQVERVLSLAVQNAAKD